MTTTPSNKMGYHRNYKKMWAEKSKQFEEHAANHNSQNIYKHDARIDNSILDSNIHVKEISLSHEEAFAQPEEDNSSPWTPPINDSSNEDDNVTPLMEDDDKDQFDLPSTQTTLQKVPLTTTTGQACSFELMRLMDDAGCSRGLYEDVKALIKKHYKKGFDLSQLMSRKALMTSLYDHFHYPMVQQKRVCGYDIYRFPFVTMLQDLLDHSSKDIHIIHNRLQSDTIELASNSSELWHSKWITDLFRHNPTYRNFDSNNEILLPLILYMDKTGTDMLQRYSLEPVLFSTAVISRESRDLAINWRHLGFIPPVTSKDDEKGRNHLQTYHDLLKILLEPIIEAQKSPPKVTVKREGENVQLIARLPLMIVMGDQKSQDTLCGRKALNSGGGPRMHRSCMCSYLNVDDPHHQCIEVSKDVIDGLTQRALVSSEYISKIARMHSPKNDSTERSVIERYLTRQQQMNKQILSHPFTQHAINNAFEDIDFGSWSSGIFAASFDDFMHSTESGIFEYLGEVVYHGLTASEKDEFTVKVRNLFIPPRSSSRSNFPRWNIGDRFTTQNLMTCGEKVGGIFLLSLALQYIEISSIYEKAHNRQRQKYVTFPTIKDVPSKHETSKKGVTKNLNQYDPLESDELDHNVSIQATPFFWEKYMSSKLTHEQIENRLISMVRHGFDIQIIKTLDIFQLHSLISHCDIESINFPNDYPKKDITNHYKKLPRNYKIPKDILNKSIEAFSVNDDDTEDLLGPHKFRNLEGAVPKHFRQKVGVKGKTCTILTEDTRSFIFFLEYMLCFHSFCKYSSSLPETMKQDVPLIDYGSRSLMEYYTKIVYRGDDSVDCRTTKIHANTRAGLNYKLLGSCIHADCQTGERLLKTKAKKISSTALKRGNSEYECSTMHRIQEETLLSQYELHLMEQQENLENCTGVQFNDMQSTRSLDETRSPEETLPCVTRKEPHFRYESSKESWVHVDKRGKNISGDYPEIHPFITNALFREEPSIPVYEIYGEIKLRDGSRVRATPNYNQTGPWYDMVNVKWQMGEHDVTLYPARCLCFYTKKDPESGGILDYKALVHGTNLPDPGTACIHNDTLLTSNYYFEWDSHPKRKRNEDTPIVPPKIYSVSLSAIEETLLWYPHISSHQNGGRTPPFHHLNTGIKIVRPRYQWAYLWMAWNKALRQRNKSTVSQKKPLVELNDDHLVRQIRKKLVEYLNISTYSISEENNTEDNFS